MLLVVEELEQEPTNLKASRRWRSRATSWRWVLSSSVPNSDNWNEIDSWTRQYKLAHIKKFEEAREELDHVSFKNINL